MKNVLKRIAALVFALVLVIGLVPLSASAADHTGGRVYFETDWTNPCIQLMIGHGSHSVGYPMTKEAGNRYYVDVPNWEGARDFAVFGTDSVWGAEHNSISHRKNYIGSNGNAPGIDETGYQFESGKKYLITSTGSDNVSVKEVFSVYVEGIQATEHNHSDMLGDGTVSYDPDTNTLTLNNASLEGALDEESGNIYLAISAVTLDEALTLVLKGSNTATAYPIPATRLPPLRSMAI